METTDENTQPEFILQLVPLDAEFVLKPEPYFDQDTREETYRLALESIVRWTDRSFDTDFRDALIVRAIAQVAEVALESL